MLHELIVSCKDAYQYLSPFYNAKLPAVPDANWTLVASKAQQRMIALQVEATPCRIKRYGARTAAATLVDALNEGQFSFGDWPRDLGASVGRIFADISTEYAAFAYHAQSCGCPTCIPPGNTKRAVADIVAEVSKLRQSDAAAAKTVLEHLVILAKPAGYFLFDRFRTEKLGAFARLPGYAAIHFLAEAHQRPAAGLQDTA